MMTANDRAPNVLYLMVDCLRSDQSVAEELAERLPNIRRMMRGGTCFSEMITVNSFTVPCIASAFTGLYPVQHRVRKMIGNRLPSTVNTLAETFQQSGYYTLGEVAGPLEKALGFDRGFDRFRMKHEETQHIYNEWGDELVDFIRTPRDVPWFAYVHFWEVHQPRRVLPGYDTPEFGDSLYERAVASWDSALGRILDSVPENTLVILTGDHGELIPRNRTENIIDRYKTPVRKTLQKLGIKRQTLRKIPEMRQRLMERLHKGGLVEDNLATMVGHGYHAYDFLVRVPFVLTHDDLVPNDALIETQVSQVDIFPTLVDLLSLDAPKQDFDGRSLAPLVRGEAWDVRPAFIEAGSVGVDDESGSPRLGAVRADDWKYIYGLTDPEFDEELYDLAADPEEQINLAAREPDQRALLRALADTHFASGPGAGGGSEMTQEDRDVMQERLRKLGYIE